MNRGYVGYSRSKRAAEAESEGKLPLTHAVKSLSEEAGITRKEAREILETLGPCEWHHTSCKFNRTNFYDVDHAVKVACGTKLLARLPAGTADRMDESRREEGRPPESFGERLARIDREDQALADDLGVDKGELKDAYYYGQDR
jgi:hypothetical protein